MQNENRTSVYWDYRLPYKYNVCKSRPRDLFKKKNNPSSVVCVGGLLALKTCRLPAIAWPHVPKFIPKILFSIFHISFKFDWSSAIIDPKSTQKEPCA